MFGDRHKKMLLEVEIIIDYSWKKSKGIEPLGLRPPHPAEIRFERYKELSDLMNNSLKSYRRGGLNKEQLTIIATALEKGEGPDISFETFKKIIEAGPNLTNLKKRRTKKNVIK